MAIEIGAQITGIQQRSVQYQDQGAPSTLYIRDVTFKTVGMPAGLEPMFQIAVTDATQWDTLQVGQTCTITIQPA
jgi:hypothetical protein